MSTQCAPSCCKCVTVSGTHSSCTQWKWRWKGVYVPSDGKKSCALLIMLGLIFCPSEGEQKEGIFKSDDLHEYCWFLSIPFVIFTFPYFSLSREHAPSAALCGPEPGPHAGALQEVWPELRPELRHALQWLSGEYWIPVFLRLDSLSPPLPRICQRTESPQTGGPEPSGTGCNNC